MTYLVTHNGAETAEICGMIGLYVEHGRVHDTDSDNYGIVGLIHGIDSLRSHGGVLSADLFRKLSDHCLVVFIHDIEV